MMTSVRTHARIIHCARDNGYSGGRLRSFAFLRPPTSWMCSDDAEAGADSVCEVHLRGEGRFSLAPDWLGKSLCYEVLPFVFDMKLGRLTDSNTNSVVIVVSPLVSLMID